MVDMSKSRGHVAMRPVDLGAILKVRETHLKDRCKIIGVKIDSTIRILTISRNRRLRHFHSPVPLDARVRSTTAVVL